MKAADFTISEPELNQALIEIDESLRREGGKIAAREVLGWRQFCIRFKLEGMPSTRPVAIRVFDWFRKQYGDRLNLDWDFGNTVAEIRHDLYLLRCPRVCARQVLLYCDPLFFGVKLEPRLSIQGPVKASLLDYLQGVTSDFAKSLSTDECNRLLDIYAHAFAALSRVEDAAEAPYAKEALDDLRQSAHQLGAQRLTYGPSRFSSLQAVEKLLKSFIQLKGQKPDKHHNLKKLSEKATLLGLSPLPSTLLDDVQCTAEVRYTSSLAGKAEALNAHYAALSLCDRIAIHLKPKSGWITQVRFVSYTLNGVPRPMRALVLSRGLTSQKSRGGNIVD